MHHEHEEHCQQEGHLWQDLAGEPVVEMKHNLHFMKAHSIVNNCYLSDFCVLLFVHVAVSHVLRHIKSTRFAWIHFT